jgi:energy-coupling factor transporter transmembrane protein EcfT
MQNRGDHHYLPEDERGEHLDIHAMNFSVHDPIAHHIANLRFKANQIRRNRFIAPATNCPSILIDNAHTPKVKFRSMAANKFELRKSARVAARSAIYFTICIFAGIFIRELANAIFFRGRHLAWRLVLELPPIMGLLWFCAFFVHTAFRFRAAAPAIAILDSIPPEDASAGEPLSGFVAMEYFALIMNRTFVVFIAPDGLYGWKAQGPVSAGNPAYFQPYAEMLEDPELMHDINAVRDLAKLNGGFMTPRSEIVSVEVIDKPKWGMAAIAHSGRISIRSASGRAREFILLGNVDGEQIKQSILS